MDLINELQAVLDAAKVDAAKFYEKGNSNAGTRVRLAMQALKVKAQEVRTSVTERKNAKA